ncbi:MAG TPA: TonB-dependent receptor [Cyclobacteriaceae bacterium]|nr:TonB-dependent receptor [Cyclobacteriaceae bacterium]
MKFFLPTIFLTAGLATAVHCQDIQDTVELSPVIIHGTPIDEPPYIVTRIDHKFLRDTDIRDVGDYLRSIPNVSGIRKGGNAIDPVVRGFKYSQLNVILSNGIRIENGCPNRMDPVSSHIEAEDIENIEVIMGPFSLRYGPNFGGVINLAAHQPEPYDKFQVHGSGIYGYESNWDGHKGNLSVEGGGAKLYFRVSGGYRDYGDYTSGKMDDGDSTYNSSFTKNNYSAKLGYSFTPGHRLMISYDIIQSRDVMYPALSMDEKSDNTGIISLDYNGKFRGDLLKSLDLKIYSSDVHHIMDNSRRPSSAQMDMVSDVNAVNTGGRGEANLAFGKHALLAGADFENIYKDGKRVGTMEMMGTVSKSISNLWQQANIMNAGIFSEYHALFSTLEFMASLRLDLNSARSNDTLSIIHNGDEYFTNYRSGFLNLSFSVGAAKMIGNHLSISLAAGKGTRSPNMLERYVKFLPVGYDSYDYLGDPGLQPESNYEADLTLKYQHESSGALHLNGFYSYVIDYITAGLLPPAVATPKTPGVLGVKQFENSGSATFKGLEFGYASPTRLKLGGNIVAAFTYAVIPRVTKYLITGTQITGETVILNDALPEIPPLEATFSAHYRMFNGRLIPKITFRAVAGQHHISEAFYEPETPGFVLMHISGSAEISKNIRILTGINNIFNRAYYEHLNRKIIGTTAKLFEPGRTFFINLSLDI